MIAVMYNHICMYFILPVVNISRICVLLVVSSNDESEGKYTSVITSDHTANNKSPTCRTNINVRALKLSIKCQFQVLTVLFTRQRKVRIPKPNIPTSCLQPRHALGVVAANVVTAQTSGKVPLPFSS